MAASMPPSPTPKSSSPRSSSLRGQAQWSPRNLGYRMPAEWERHAATWVSWPHNQDSWPGRFSAAETGYALMVAQISRREPVHINVADAAMQERAAHLLNAAQASSNIVFHPFPTNDAWCRDHGGVIVVREVADRAAPPRIVIDWGYNAWGGKYPPFDLDNAIPQKMARFLEIPSISGGMILEGGSIDVNGEGLLMTTESCLLNPNRNPHLTRPEIETRLRTMLGVDHILWLGDGIAGDDTDGHVDDLTRFVNKDTVVTVIETDRDDANYAPLQQNYRTLREWTSAAGQKLNVVTLPMPAKIIYEGQRLPASYANFYIGNSAVYVPQFHQSTDEVARGVLAEQFPHREIVGIDCRDLIVGLGAVHCLTQQVPAA